MNYLLGSLMEPCRYVLHNPGDGLCILRKWELLYRQRVVVSAIVLITNYRQECLPTYPGNNQTTPNINTEFEAVVDQIARQVSVQYYMQSAGLSSVCILDVRQTWMRQ